MGTMNKKSYGPADEGAGSNAQGLEKKHFFNADLSFSSALTRLKEGERVTRSGWNGKYGKDVWLELHVSSAQPDAPAPYIYRREATSELVPWVPDQNAVLAEDWEVVE